MLVLAINKDNGSGVRRSIERYAQRVSKLWGQVRYGDGVSKGDIKELLAVIEEANLYLPDDWRMTRSKNNFRIFVRIESESNVKSYVLAGQSFRQTNGSILHEIHTVLEPQFLDHVDTSVLAKKHGARALSRDRHSGIHDRLRMDHPELVRPNLYFLKPRLDDCPSPLFARQYERVFEDNSLYEFHRIHPLTKAGVDRRSFRWLRWTCFGDAALVKRPQHNAHGRDYWSIPPVGFEKATRIMQAHRRLLKENDITMLQGESPDGPYEVEYKLLYPGDANDRQSIFECAEQIIHRSGLTVDSRKYQVQNDTYLDDDDFTILSGGGSLRVRQTSETTTLTFKATRSHVSESDGEYNRLEENLTITQEEASLLLSGQRLPASPTRALQERFPACSSLAPRVKVETTRELLHARNRSGQDAEVCFDFIRFLDLFGKELGRGVEIEIESKGMPVTQIARLADVLRRELDLEPSPQSKYQRAIDYLEH